MTRKPFLIVFSNLGLGGIQKKIINIVNWLARADPRLPIFILLRRKESYLDLSNKIRNKNTEIIYYDETFGVKPPFFFTFFTVYQVWKLKPKSVLAFLSPFGIPVILAKLVFFWRKMVVVVNEDHLTSTLVSRLPYSKLNSWGVKWFYPLADFILSPTRAAKEDLIDNFGVSRRKIRVVPNWSDFPVKKNKGKKKFDLIYVGRLAAHKKVDLLIKAVAKIKEKKPNIKLCILGDGEVKKELAKLVKREKLVENVTFFGVRVDVDKFLDQSLLFASFSRSEGFPLAMMESMSRGVPVLATHFGGEDEVLKNDQTGFIFDSTEDFIAKVIYLLNNPKKVARVAEKARKLVAKKYTVEKNINSFFKVLDL